MGQTDASLENKRAQMTNLKCVRLQFEESMSGTVTRDLPGVGVQRVLDTKGSL